MMQTISTMDYKYSERILCYYVNVSSQMQIARITNIPNCDFESIVFPGQRLLFEAVPQAELEIHTYMTGRVVLLDRIKCNCLRVSEGISGDGALAQVK